MGYFSNTDETGTFRKADQQINLDFRLALNKVVDEFPEDCSLWDAEDGQIQHGFNSGAFETFRYGLKILENGIIVSLMYDF